MIGALSDVRVDFRLSQIIAKVKLALEESRGSDPQRYEQSDDQEGDDIFDEDDTRSLMMKRAELIARGTKPEVEL